jgi:hypothetical protein
MRGLSGAGWSSLAARRAHNPKVVGSNPTPATNQVIDSQDVAAPDSIVEVAESCGPTSVLLCSTAFGPIVAFSY